MYTILVTSDEARSGAKGNPIMTEKGQKFWPRIDSEGWVEATSSMFYSMENVPSDVKTFKDKNSAIKFGNRWKGHPWWVVPISFEVVELQPITVTQTIGFKAVGV